MCRRNDRAVQKNGKETSVRSSSGARKSLGAGKDNQGLYRFNTKTKRRKRRKNKDLRQLDNRIK